MSVNSILCRCSLSRRARGPFTILYYNEINVNTQIHTVARRFFTSSISEIFVCRGARSSLGAVRGGCLYITPLPVYFVGRLVYDAKTPSKEDNPNEFRYCIEVNDDTRSRRTYTVYALDSHSVKACTETPRIVEMRRQTQTCSLSEPWCVPSVFKTPRRHFSYRSLFFWVASLLRPCCSL